MNEDLKSVINRYVADFVKELAIKFSAGEEELMHIWAECSARKNCEQANVEVKRQKRSPDEELASEPKTEKIRCIFVPTRAKNKGVQCPNTAMKGKEYCCVHISRAVKESAANEIANGKDITQKMKSLEFVVEDEDDRSEVSELPPFPDSIKTANDPSPIVHMTGDPVCNPTSAVVKTSAPPPAVVKASAPPPSAVVKASAPPPSAVAKASAPPPSAVVKASAPPPAVVKASALPPSADNPHRVSLAEALVSEIEAEESIPMETNTVSSKVKTTCTFVMEKGARKGQVCGASSSKQSVFCCRHTPEKKAEKKAKLEQETVLAVPAPPKPQFTMQPIANSTLFSNKQTNFLFYREGTKYIAVAKRIEGFPVPLGKSDIPQLQNFAFEYELQWAHLDEFVEKPAAPAVKTKITKEDVGKFHFIKNVQNVEDIVRDMIEDEDQDDEFGYVGRDDDEKEASEAEAMLEEDDD